MERQEERASPASFVTRTRRASPTTLLVAVVGEGLLTGKASPPGRLVGVATVALIGRGVGCSYLMLSIYGAVRLVALTPSFLGFAPCPEAARQIVVDLACLVLLEGGWGRRCRA